MFIGLKASVYEGGHRVPFLYWWPSGIDTALHGTSYDLPVSQTDLYATFADVMKYPLPTGDSCIYGYDSSNADVHGREAAALGRRVVQNCRPIGDGEDDATTTVEPPTTTTVLHRPNADWAANNSKRCDKEKLAGEPCSWETCDECIDFWTRAKQNRDANQMSTGRFWLSNKIKNFCTDGSRCYKPEAK